MSYLEVVSDLRDIIFRACIIFLLAGFPVLVIADEQDDTASSQDKSITIRNDAAAANKSRRLGGSSSNASAGQARARAQRNRVQGVGASLINPKLIKESVVELPNGSIVVTREGQHSGGRKLTTTTVIGGAAQVSQGKNAEACTSIGSLGDDTQCNE